MNSSRFSLQFSRFHAWRTRLSAWVLLLCSICTALTDTYDFGPASLSHMQARKLETRIPLDKNLAKAPKIRFVGKVGGVAFDAVAEPATEFAVKSLSMIYDAAQPDGQRLVLKMNGKAVTAPLHDWQLLPIARYVEGKTTSCFTLFGDLENTAEAEELKNNGARILNYDAAFEDTLLGLRLFQLDVFLLHEGFATELPKRDGKFMLGAGETAPDVLKNRVSLGIYERERDRIIDKGNSDEGGFETDFQSYVICDQFVDIRFSMDKGKLSITGEPRYYFWYGNEQELRSRYLAEAAIEYGLVKKGTDPDLIVLELALKGADLEGDEKTAFEDKLEEVAAAANKRVAAEMEKEDGVKATYLDKYSTEHAKLAGKLEAINPPVWQAARNTMRYGAFFRWVAAKHPKTWEGFFKSIGDKRPEPPKAGGEPVENFKTPTVMQMNP